MPRGRATWIIVVATAVAIAACVIVYAKSRKPAAPPQTTQREMTGLVLNVNSEKGTISVANDDIPGFMQPMVMTYKVRKTEDLGGVKRGQEIHATVVNKGDDWQLDRLTTSDPPR